METSLYVSLSGQVALQNRLDTIANNVANSTTTGFRAENVTFTSVLSQTSRASVTYADEGVATFAATAGALAPTGNPLDTAVKGDAYLAFASPAGPVYTRDGRLQVSANGDLETLNGRPILDAGGGPIQINLARGPIVIGNNGAISQNGAPVGQLGLFKFTPGTTLTRHEGAGLVPDRPAEPVIDFTETGIVQGYVEGSNVNAMLEMTRLVAVSRAFESISAMQDKSDGLMTEAIRTLGNGR